MNLRYACYEDWAQHLWDGYAKAHVESLDKDRAQHL